MDKYDLVVIGAGPGGYVAAIRGAQLGFKTALIEKRSTLGGTCLNVGCIPSKALLDSSEHYLKASKEFEVHGIKVGKLDIDFPRMIARKQEVVEQTVAGVHFLMEKNGITVLHGMGAFVDAHTIEVTSGKGKSQQVQAERVLIATGSEPASLPFIKLDGDRIITSTEALSLPSLPKSMAIIGGGVIGLELGSVYARLGTEVHVIEYQDAIIPTMDRTMGKELQRAMKKIGVKFHLSHGVKEAVNAGGKATVKADDKKGKEVTWEVDYCLVAVGRKPYTDGLGLDKAGVPLDDRGRVEVDGHLRTVHPHIYAIGDVVKGVMLAHKAEDEGLAAAEIIAGETGHVNYDVIPGIVYTWPEVASVGKTEEQLKDEGVTYKVGKFPFSANGRARAANETDGFVKLLADAATDRVLGAHIIGPDAGTLIHEIVVGMEFGASAEDIARTCHGHPTLSEAVKEAALAVDGRTIHI